MQQCVLTRHEPSSGTKRVVCLAPPLIKQSSHSAQVSAGQMPTYLKSFALCTCAKSKGRTARIAVVEQEQKVHGVQFRRFPFQQLLASARNVTILHWLKYEPICFVR